MYSKADRPIGVAFVCSNVFPVTLSSFVERHFDTVSAVDVLLHLRREQPRSCTSRAVARQLRLDPDQTENILARLDEHGLVRRQGRSFEYGPRSEQAAGTVDTLAAVYPQYRHRIVGIIFPGR
jgi:hypothetical protein